ncbi:cytochrome P450 [Streptomyces sp. NPDC014983]|uniref:cytochrome P450 n=1 Tax=Streptomyces sp. NPDC014983 TaxID=3364933 RepID=UPI0037022B85
MQAAVDRLLHRFTEELRQGPADFCTLVAEELPIAVVGEWMHIPRGDYALLRSLTHDQVHVQELAPTRSQLALSDAATEHLRFYFAELVQERRRAPGPDPVSSWLREWDRVEPDRTRADAAVHALAIFMVLAALETTSYLLCTVVQLLLDDPRRMVWLRKHPEHVHGAIEETLRYDAPIHLISRVAAADIELGDVLVPAGEMIQLVIGAAHHDPEKYPDPHIFDPCRGAQHLAFGTGAHYCLGNALARMEAGVLLTALIKLPFSLQISAAPEWAPRRLAFRRMQSLQLELA